MQMSAAPTGGRSSDSSESSSSNSAPSPRRDSLSAVMALIPGPMKTWRRPRPGGRGLRRKAHRPTPLRPALAVRSLQSCVPPDVVDSDLSSAGATAAGRSSASSDSSSAKSVASVSRCKTVSLTLASSTCHRCPSSRRRTGARPTRRGRHLCRRHDAKAAEITGQGLVDGFVVKFVIELRRFSLLQLERLFHAFTIAVMAV